MVTHRNYWCLGPDLNRHGGGPPRDFKSLASTNSATQALSTNLNSCLRQGGVTRESSLAIANNNYNGWKVLSISTCTLVLIFVCIYIWQKFMQDSIGPGTVLLISRRRGVREVSVDATIEKLAGS